MNVSRIIAITKIIAKAIEKRSPGSCSGIIKDLDKASNNPLVIKQRIDFLKQYWNNHKGNFSESEINAISSEIESISGEAKFDLSDPSQWDSFLGIVDVPETITGVGETIVEVGDATDGVESAGEILGDIFGDIVEFLADLFS